MSSVAKVAQEIVRGFREVTVGSVGDAVRQLGFHGDMCSAMNPLFPCKIVGHAITVKEEACTESVPPTHMIEAVELAQKGDVICISNGGDPEVALIGGMACAACRSKGVEAAVIDGGIRDIEENISTYQFPMFSISTTPVTTLGKYKTVSINEPTVIGNVLVHPGDIIVGDRDGVVCVPADLAKEALRLAREFDDMEAEQTRYIIETGSMKAGIAKYNRI